MSIPVASYTNQQHLYDELAWLDLRLLQLLLNEETSSYLSGNDLRWIVQAKDLLASAGLSDKDFPETPADAEKQAHIKRDEIARRIIETEAAGIHLCLPWVARLFGLAPFEYDVLVLCLAAELDRKYDRVYTALQSGLNQPTPTVDLVLRILCNGAEDRLLARRSFLQNAPLGRCRLISGLEASTTLLMRPLRIEEGLLNFLLGNERFDARFAHAVSFADDPGADSVDPQQEESQLGSLSESLQRYLDDTTEREWLCVMHGPDLVGQEDVARWLCAQVGIALVSVDLQVLVSDGWAFEEAIRLVLRESALRRAAVFLAGTDLLLSDVDGQRLKTRALEQALELFGTVTFLGGSRAWVPTGRLATKAIVFEQPLLPYAYRKQRWSTILWACDGAEPVEELVETVARFRFTRGAMDRVAERLKGVVRGGQESQRKITRSDVLEACRTESHQRSINFATKIVSPYSWEDLILPEEPTQQLRELIHYVEQLETIRDDWGFGRKHLPRHSVNVLLSGPSGTGKTMAVGVVANELGLDLYRIDLSMVVSKYIGETEKQLSRIFADAEAANAILFFDEADALFGKRTDVKDAHDRYANIGVDYLLQKLDEHEGLVFLATNFSKNLDDAFLRRLHFTVVFPLPEKKERLAMWQRVFPPEAPLAPDLDFDFLARNFKLTGSGIRNVAITAAFLARLDRVAIGMRHIMLAIKRDFQKAGRICQKADFGEYHELVS